MVSDSQAQIIVDGLGQALRCFRRRRPRQLRRGARRDHGLHRPQWCRQIGPDPHPLRPASTTLSTILGTLPIALGIGAGAESRQPLGVAVMGGLVFLQLLTLHITPTFFVSMEQLLKRAERPT